MKVDHDNVQYASTETATKTCIDTTLYLPYSEPLNGKDTVPYELRLQPFPGAFSISYQSLAHAQFIWKHCARDRI